MPRTKARSNRDKESGAPEDYEIDWIANPGPQTEAYESEADEVLYGGAAGGGKTALLVGLALSEHVKSIIFRRLYTNIYEIEDQIDETVGPIASSNKTKHRWTLPDARFVELGAMQREDDWKKYQGRPHDFIGFDELPQFTERQYRMSIAWARSTIQGQRVRVVAAGNPPLLKEEEWVIDAWGPWVDEEFKGERAKPGELRWYIYNEEDAVVWVDGPEPVEGKGGDYKFPKSRTFIPASLDDNPYLSYDDEYKATLDALPAEVRNKLRYGEFSRAGLSDPFQLIPTAWVKTAQDRWLQIMADTEAAEIAGDLDDSDDVEVMELSQVGVDPSRGGRDDTVIAKRYGEFIDKLVRYPGKEAPDGPTVAGYVIKELRTGQEQVVIDIIGYGSSPYDYLVDNGVNVLGFNASERDAKARDKSGRLAFFNKRAEGYWHLRELLDPEGLHRFALPPGRGLLTELTEGRFKITPTGIQMESKDDIKARLGGKSPDDADAVMYACVDFSVDFLFV